MGPSFFLFKMGRKEEGPFIGLLSATSQGRPCETSTFLYQRPNPLQTTLLSEGGGVVFEGWMSWRAGARMHVGCKHQRPSGGSTGEEGCCSLFLAVCPVSTETVDGNGHSAGTVTV